jgi:hypothetical protein
MTILEFCHEEGDLSPIILLKLDETFACSKSARKKMNNILNLAREK